MLEHVTFPFNFARVFNGERKRMLVQGVFYMTDEVSDSIRLLLFLMVLQTRKSQRGDNFFFEISGEGTVRQVQHVLSLLKVNLLHVKVYGHLIFNNTKHLSNKLTSL
jgi:hypothetical protein